MAQTIVLRNNPAYKEGSLLGYYLNSQSRFNPVPITLSRDSEAYVEKNGVLTRVNPDVPRIDSDGALLVEPQRTNLEDNSNTSTGYILTRITRGSSTSRKGIDGFLYSDNGSGTPNLLNNAISFASGDYVFSVFIDATNSDSFQINLSTDGNASNGVFATFTPSTESFSAITENTTQVTASSGFVGYESFGDNVYRIWIGANFKTGSTTFTPIVYIGTGNSNVFIGGWQLEQGSYATSYIKTEGATATRSADVVSQTGLANLLGDAEGSLYVEASWFSNAAVASGASGRIQLSDGTETNRILIQNNLGQFRLVTTKLGTTQGNISGGTLNVGTYYKIAARYAINDFSLYADGSSIGTDTIGFTFSDATLTQLNFNNTTGVGPFYGKIKALAVYDTALDNSELANITTNGI